MLNALTVDLEDWAQTTLGPDTPITGRFVDSTRAVLRLFRSCQVKATFFALGKVVELYPDVLKEVRDEGHEVGSHGYGHELLYNITPQRFREDVVRGLDVVEGITGIRPMGYRAPSLSIVRETMWAGPILAELGFAYSSSIFPFAGPRYGMPEAPRGPHRWSTCDLWELPLSTLKVAGRNRPVCGGVVHAPLRTGCARSEGAAPSGMEHWAVDWLSAIPVSQSGGRSAARSVGKVPVRAGGHCPGARLRRQAWA